MSKKIRFLILLLLCSPILIYSQTGKIVGTVTDLETGEALIGANVLIEGTNQGAATDLNGNYFILSVEPGTYTLIARYIGFREMRFENIRVSVNLTTETNFGLPSETYSTEEIVVVAPRPLINKNITNTTSIVTQDDIKNLPVRGVNAIVGTQAGVVTEGDNIYVRGSRSDATAYYVDGVLVNDPVFGGSQTGIINNAIEEIQVQSGGYSAEYGGANGGIISSSTRTGKDSYNFGFEVITDNFTSRGEEFLGGYTYGYNEYVLTIGGPIVPSYKDLKFFFAGNNVFNRTGAGYYREYNFAGVVDPDTPTDTFDVYYPNGQILNNASNTYQLQGNLTWSPNPIIIKLNVNHRTNENRSGAGWQTVNRVNSAGLNQSHTFTTSAKITHVVSPKAFYDVIFNYFDDFSVQMDPIFKHNLVLYGDSVENAKYGRTLRRDGEFTTQLRAFGLTFTRNDRPWNEYFKNKFQSFGGKLNFLYQLGTIHEFKMGGEYTYYTIRRYQLPSPITIAENIKSNPEPDGIRLVYNRLDNYGYDIYGNEVTGAGDVEGPKHPVFAAFYIQDKMEFSDLVLNVGFRLDYIDTDSKTFQNPSNVVFDANSIIDPSTMVEVDPTLQVSPRIGFSFPVTDQTVFHAQYGKFIQQSRLRDIYLGFNRSSDVIKGGFAELNPVGYGLKPERTTSYEIGFKQQLGDNFAFDITGFYKDIKDQIQIRTIFAEASAGHTAYYANVNGDFSTIKGVEFKLDLRRTNRLSAALNYTFSNAEGTGSTPNSAGRTIWQSPTTTPFFPSQIAPLDFNQTHRGSLVLDYRFADNDGGPVFENLGLNFFFSFNSGFHYTKWIGFFNDRTPTEALNSSTTPWNFQVDARLDKSFGVGPLNFNVYLLVVNLFDIKNVIDVYNTSGDAVDDGWLASPQGSSIIDGYRANHGEEIAQRYQDLYLASIYDRTNFGPPRQFMLGVRIDY